MVVETVQNVMASIEEVTTSGRPPLSGTPEIKQAIRICILTSKKELMACTGKETAQKDASQALLDKIEQPTFWTSLAEAHTHLEPLVITTNATQGDHAHLDVVLIMLGNLFYTYCDTIKYSFKNNPLLIQQNLWSMFKCNYEHMEQRPVDKKLKVAFMEYLNAVGDISRCNRLIKFALRLFLIVPNSAMIERVFSRFGTVHTKLRNRLHPEKVRKVVLVKANIDCVYGTSCH
ncbi:hypothetical protein BD311DRAFT_742872 [Dichomitus squalens]|uniref:HAT C-terminal dimerisation domain-containing protein n=1 Tax=Dichomitus squalens TaxID=114155 RepID=A0A4Q9M9Q3_9APHY|nr:hypothetical protein BD311DRAFT_742872 [Dichomitus squalens]